MPKTLSDLAAQYPYDPLIEYMQKCRSGQIVVGRELLQEFDILMDNFNDPDIAYDSEDAQKRIRFIETKCRLYEAPYDGKPFLLELFQKAFITAIYSFKIFDEELNQFVRLYQEVLFLVARKNGKTPLVSAICLAEFFCGYKGTKILCSSNDYEQASLSFDAINAMREQSPSLECLTRKNIKGIYFGNPKHQKKHGKFSFENHGTVKKISAKTGAKEGKNISVGMVDEVHELPDNSSIMPIRQALSTQPSPLYFELTTEGFVSDGYLDGRLREARQVLDGKLDRPRWLVWLYTQDEPNEIWRDEKTWVKSNPGLGTIKKWSFLRQMIEEAKTNKATRAFVLSKDFNERSNTSTSWLTPQEYENPVTFAQLAEKMKISDFMEYLRGCYAIFGIDLAETTDLACMKAVIMHRGDPHKYILRKYMIPEIKLNDCPDDLDYKEMSRQGRITICPGNENDFSLFTQWAVELYKKYGIKPYKFGYDNALAKFWVKEMSEIFGAEFMERVPQTHQALSSPMLLAEQDLKSKLIVYDDDPIDKFCLKNTAMDMNKYGQIKPMKDQSKPKNRIDGTAALLDCYAIYQAYKPDYMKYVG